MAAIAATPAVFERREFKDPMGVPRPHDYSVQKILSLNLCFFFQYIKDPVLNARLGLEARLPKIIHMIQSQKPDIILLQEGREGVEQGSFFETIAKVCSATKMIPIFQHNNGDQASFIHVTLYDPQKYFHVSSERFYPRARPEDRGQWGDEFGNGFGRQSTVNCFIPKRRQEVKANVWSDAPDYQARPLAVVNQHFGLGVKERRQHTTVTIDEMNRRYPGHNVISAGDHNPLPTPDAGPIEAQLAPFTESGWQRLTTPPYRTQDGVEVTGSFVGLPSADPWVKAELVKKEGSELKPDHFGNQLDHIFYRRPLDGKPDYATPDGKEWRQDVAFRTHNVVGRFDGTDPQAPQMETEYFAPGDRREEFYSDHMAVVTEMHTTWVQKV